MDELRNWAAANYEDTSTFWDEFSNRVLAAIGNGDVKPYSDLYAEFELHGADIRRKHDMEAWMG